MSDAIDRIKKYIEAYEDAPNWGGPTMYPAPPEIADLKALVSLVRDRDWHDIATAPQDGTEIDLWLEWPSGLGESNIARWEIDDQNTGWWLLDSGFFLHQYHDVPIPTHWMARPSSPQHRKKQQ